MHLHSELKELITSSDPFYEVRYWEKYHMMLVSLSPGFDSGDHRNNSLILAKCFTLYLSNDDEVLGFEVLGNRRDSGEAIDVDSLKDYLKDHGANPDKYSKLWDTISKEFPAYDKVSVY